MQLIIQSRLNTQFFFLKSIFIYSIWDVLTSGFPAFTCARRKPASVAKMVLRSSMININFQYIGIDI